MSNILGGISERIARLPDHDRNQHGLQKQASDGKDCVVQRVPEVACDRTGNHGCDRDLNGN